MKTTKEKLEVIANSVKANVRINTSLEDREQLLLSALKNAGFDVSTSYKDLPHTGAAFVTKEFKTEYRINYRCGYGKNNYAPCVIIKKLV